MRYPVLATDYDGTLATHGTVEPATLDALMRWRAAGRLLLLVSGRELPDLQSTFSRLDLFDLAVLENGATIYNPQKQTRTSLAAAPPAIFAETLRARGVNSLSVGDVIVATWEPFETTVLAVIRELGLELEVIFNKGAVMVLPTGVNKGSGLRAALKSLGMTAEQTVGVGDAENDHSLIEACGMAAAVANAVPALKDRADFITQADHGAGVAELIDRILLDDLAGVAARPKAKAG